MTARWVCVGTAIAALLVPHWIAGGGADPAGFVTGLLLALLALLVRAAAAGGSLPGQLAQADN